MQRRRLHLGRDLDGPRDDPGPGPTVCEVAASEDEDPDASHREDQRSNDWGSAQGDPRGGPGKRNPASAANGEEHEDRVRHHNHRGGGRNGIGSGPLPADGELSPHTESERHEDGCGTSEGEQRSSSSLGGLEVALIQPSVGEAGDNPTHCNIE